jgi:hypothetical protein
MKDMTHEVVDLKTNQAMTTSPSYQSRVHDWMMACFNDEIAFSVQERNHRFLEEALELVQSQGCTRHEAMQLIDYVFGRHAGEPAQEVGGVLVCLAALCTASSIDMARAGETELARIWTKVEAIRAKHAAKPQFSPLPGTTPADVSGGVRQDWTLDNMPDPKAVGMAVEKVEGYPFPGEIRAVFTTKAGAVRVVVEATGSDYAGMLHIFNARQLAKARRS